MKKPLVIISLIVIVVCSALLIFKAPNTAKEDSNSNNNTSFQQKIDEIVVQINRNVSLQTYINNIDLYSELIKIEPKNIKWYIGLAETRLNLGQKSSYQKVCKEIIKLFPNEKEGHLMLIEYYSSKNKDRDVIRTYNEAPEHIKANHEFLLVYQKHEWAFRFRGGSFQNITSGADSNFVIERYGDYGYRNKDLLNGINPKYDIARPFIEDYAAVLKDKEWYFIDKAGYKVLASRESFQDMYSMSEGFAVAKKNGKYGYIDASFIKYHFEYDDATSFYCGVAAVKKGDKWALINKEFNNITDFIYDDVIRDEANVCSRNGVIFLKRIGNYFALNVEGKPITSMVFDDAHLFYSDIAPVKQGDRWGFINTSGELVMKFMYDDASSCADGIAAVCKNGMWGFIDMTGRTVVPFEYQYARITSDDGIAIIKTNGKYKFANFVKYIKYA